MYFRTIKADKHCTHKMQYEICWD